MKNSQDVVKFWFEDHNHEDWFGGKQEFDQKLKANFFDLHAQVAAGEAFGWRVSGLGRLAEIVVLDQFSRQFYRGEAKAFAQDPMALTLAQELVAAGQDLELSSAQRLFAYLPYMHSESPAIHEEAVRLYTVLGDEGNLKFEQGHQDVIARFGRFPKRNEALGRTSTAEETAYIAGRSDSAF